MSATTGTCGTCGQPIHLQPRYVDWLPGQQRREPNPLAWFHLSGTLCCCCADEALRAPVRPRRGRCHYCQRQTDLTRDHVVPLSRGGSKNRDNIVPACRPCNQFKGDRLLSELPADWPQIVLQALDSPRLTSRATRRGSL